MKGALSTLGVLGVMAGLSLLRPAARARDSAVEADQARDRLDRVLDRVRQRSETAFHPLQQWPVEPGPAMSLGDDTNVFRKKGRHQGIDIRVPAGTAVVAPEDMTVIGVNNGMGSKDEHKEAAGIWIDARGAGGRVLRFLHLATGSVRVQQGQLVRAGQVVGEVADQGDSGNERSRPHLHFEVRRPDWKKGPDDQPINPAMLLPFEGSPAVLRQLASLRKRHEEMA